MNPRATNPTVTWSSFLSSLGRPFGGSGHGSLPRGLPGAGLRPRRPTFASDPTPQKDLRVLWLGLTFSVRRPLIRALQQANLWLRRP